MSDEGEGDGGHGGGGGEYCKPKQASAVRKGTYVMLKDHPCKIVDMSTSKTGKHGHAKVKMTGVCVLTDKKYQELYSSTHNCYEPEVSKMEMQVRLVPLVSFVAVGDSG